jgi:hypothetical protein
VEQSKNNPQTTVTVEEDKIQELIDLIDVHLAAY